MRSGSSVFPHFVEVFSLLRMSGIYPSNVGTFFETDVRESVLFMPVRTAVIRSGLKDSRFLLHQLFCLQLAICSLTWAVALLPLVFSELDLPWP